MTDKLKKEIVNNYLSLESMLEDYYKSKNYHPQWRYAYKGQNQLLSLLKKYPLISQKELVSLVNMRPQSASEMIGKLEQKGLLRRYPSRSDRRILMIELTDKGRAFSYKIHTEDTIFLNRLTEDEMIHLNQLLNKLLLSGEELLKQNGLNDPFSTS
ncbi:hypothetical protein NRIC_09400 [Enterococcus florum]|uniref:HTH marR-type domain-containing protein n=1 Tax=Enterococcus florum TaxID=2480627 RepID=A0A4V0WP92_9ENTE|nr:MarR family transcriptional regulator [Enterococcus florum]GCF93049.1 hypothetical protein NRIC_09400 [Enterococcus florum]